MSEKTTNVKCACSTVKYCKHREPNQMENNQNKFSVENPDFFPQNFNLTICPPNLKKEREFPYVRKNPHIWEHCKSYSAIHLEWNNTLCQPNVCSGLGTAKASVRGRGQAFNTTILQCWSAYCSLPVQNTKTLTWANTSVNAVGQSSAGCFNEWSYD